MARDGVHAVRVLVSERDVRVRAALRTLLGATGGVDVVAEAEDCAATVTMADQLRPDVVLAGVRPGDQDGFELVRVLAAAQVAVVAVSFESAAREQALQAGAACFLDQDGALDELHAVLSAFRIRVE